ncbi:cutinase family protein [Amycolatopsis sp. CA-230715]|uniref:cutinase family protein n=1 Tax=Amycolatopsis sp. CA-230715 TaxID=2745196 RepID=UPI001C020708|nr:cutinase family protein [Amycolatopsis sp. CA-230715]QWF83937.1 putative cutinase [Amycolatopsis sp. CA-230715]
MRSTRPSSRTPKRVAAELLAATIALAGASVVMAAPAAGAASCSDVDVVVARGTGEPGALGVIVGDPVFSAVRGKLEGKSVSSYAVDYPASLATDSASKGNKDLVEHVTNQAAACPGQRFVLIGYSQGANVVGNSVGVSSEGAVVGGPIVATIPADLGSKVAALVVFGAPIAKRGEHITGEYGDRTKEFCAKGDVICEPGGGTMFPHLGYGRNAGEAAEFVAGKV